MKTVLWKEFRENLKWTAILLLLIFGYMAAFGACLCDSFFAYVSFVSAIFGSVLGIVQTTFESGGDRRALFLHRPIGRTNLFLAKVTSGTLLFLFAMGFPLACYFVTKVITGKVAPQLPLNHRIPLLLPWFADVLTGLTWYFAGVLAGLRPGRWYGGRILGFPVALLASFLAWNLAAFYEVLVALFIFATVIGFAAWGSFLTAADSDSQPLLAGFGRTCTFLIGLSVLSLYGKSIVESMTSAAGSDFYNARYAIMSDGQVLILEQLDRETMRVRDGFGQDVEQFRHLDLRETYAELQKMTPPSALADSVAWHTSGQSYRNTSQSLIPISNHTLPYGEAWCFAPALGQLIGYDYVSRKQIGRIGPEGFAPAGETCRSVFQGSPDYSPLRANPDYLVFPHGVYFIDFEKRQVQKVFSPSADEAVRGARNWHNDPPISEDRKSVPGIATLKRGSSEESERIVVGTNRAVYILDKQGKREVVFPAQHDPRRFTIYLYSLNDPQRYAVQYLPSYFEGLLARESMKSHIVEYAIDGTELSRTTLPALPWHKDSDTQSLFGWLTSPAEAAVLLKFFANSVFKTNIDNVLADSKFQHSFVQQYYPILPGVHALSEGLKNPNMRVYVMGLAGNAAWGMLCCVWLSRRLEIVGLRSVLWISYGILFGAVGALVMTLVHEWPVRVACPQCQRLRLVTRDICQRCDAHHAMPSRDGTEVFPLTSD